mmetsp:Transcript_25626/g.65121  ORF Transcript_25626/g.65121 Transcript_25626/m.65121 type:complete len:235 (-) Transcript_25626:225-929(-)
MSGFFRGTSTDQVKCVNAEQKLIKSLEKKGMFPEHFAKKVDITKVSMDVLRPWITRRITELMGFEDDIVVDFCITQLEEKSEKGLDPKLLQVNMTGFMERKAAPFCSEVWTHLLSAQESPVGVPRDFIDKKKDELRQKREEAERVQEELQRRKRDLEEAQGGGGVVAMQQQGQRGGRQGSGAGSVRRSSRSRSGGRRHNENNPGGGGGGGGAGGRAASRSPSPQHRQRERRRFA